MSTDAVTTDIHLDSARVANAALAGGWTRCLPWPVAVLGEYGADATTDADLDDHVERLTATRPGAPVSLGDGNPPAVLSACAGRTRSGQPVIRLSLRVV